MASELPDHLVPLVDGWGLWRDFVLRGAGFPAARVLELACPDAAARADQLADAETDAERARKAAVGAVVAHRDGVPREALTAWTKVVRRLRASELPAEVPGDAPAQVTGALDAYRAARAAVEAARAALASAFAREGERAGARLRELARDPAFREALTWQNHAVIARAVDPLAATPPSAHDERTRQKEQLVASYLQRYCAKNDSIGFFGPIVWGELRPEGPPVDLRPGPTLLARRRVYLEFWAADALAARIAAVPGIAPWLAPRRTPFLALDGDVLVTPGDRQPLRPAVAAVLRACDGARTAHALARELLARRADPALGSEADVLACLEELRGLGALVWTLEVPSSGESDLLGYLRRRVEAIEDAAVRAPAAALLEEVTRACDAVAAAAGDAAALDRALSALEETFTRVTGSAATRRAGAVYAGRTLVHEDCRRNVEVAFGPAVVRELGPPLALLLAGARYSTHARAAIVRAEFERIFASLRAELGADAVPVTRFWVEAQPAVLARAPGRQLPALRACAQAYQQRWAEILGVREDVRRIEHRAQDLAPRVRDAFGAATPGWPSARYHAPDVMLAAQSADAIARGEYRFVLGEVHPGVNTTEVDLFLDEHPDRARLARAVDRDLPAGRVTLAAPKMRASRRFPTSFATSGGNVDVESDMGRSWRARAQVVAAGDLVVCEVAGALRVRTRDGARAWDVLEFFDMVLPELAHDLLPPMRHTPRVTIDRLVICREAWGFACDELAFVRAEAPLERFAGARRWARAVGLPRLVFFKADAEPKPCFLDLESPTFVELFARQLRRSKAVRVSEMYPTPEECWLEDAGGARYTSELRLVAVDPERWRPGG